VEGDRATLKKIYDYAEWCFRQEDPRVINAVAVSFYEHLIDEPGTYNAMPDWVSYDIFLEIADLLVDRSDVPTADLLRNRYKARQKGRGLNRK
jgi:GTP cyclohydrolase III